MKSVGQYTLFMPTDLADSTILEKLEEIDSGLALHSDIILTNDAKVHGILMPIISRLCPNATIIGSGDGFLGFGTWAQSAIQTEEATQGKCLAVLLLELQAAKVADPHKGLPTPESQVRDDD